MIGSSAHALTMCVKDRVKRWQYSEHISKRQAYRFLKQSWVVMHYLIDGRLRSERLTEWEFKEHYYQRSTVTMPNRYPLLFRQTQSYLGDGDNICILSFGCSTGEEVFTLGEYFPNATIVGVDINKWCIRQCRKTNHSERYFFLHRLSSEFEQATSFDAIFCMAVFQRTENRTSSDNGLSIDFTFSHFEQEIEMLDGKLKEGGILVVDHSDFSFMDTACSTRYAPLDCENNQLQRCRPLFDRDNRKIADTQNAFRVFVKHPARHQWRT